MPLAVLLPVVVLAVLAFNVRVPYVALGPGPTFDTLGDVEGTPVIEIEGVEPDPTTGELVMTTVGVTDNLTLAQTVLAWFSGRYGLSPREQVYPPTRSKDDVKAADHAQFTQSELSAELAALHYLDMPVTLRVAQVADDAPATGVLHEGDRILAVGGETVGTAGQVQRAVGDTAPGSDLEVTIERDGVEEVVPVTVGGARATRTRASSVSVPKRFRTCRSPSRSTSPTSVGRRRV